MSEEREIELQILHQFHKALAKDSQETAGIRDLTPHVSAMVYDCLRRCYYQLTDPRDTIDLKGSIRTWVGRKVHTTQILNGEMELDLYWKEDGVGILRGRLDEYDGNVLLDKKSTRYTPKTPYEHHFAQTNLYNLLLHILRGESAKYLAIMYINIDNAEIKVFVRKANTQFDALRKQVKQKSLLLRSCIAKGILPPRIIQQWHPGSAKVVCEYCGYYGRCWKENFIDPYYKFWKMTEKWLSPQA